ncbi:MAG: hypothetical protein ACFFCT_12115 [Candidatus Odinarchaeota archaeon]
MNDELKYEERLGLLRDILPHGSGINGDWGFELKGDIVEASNFYSAMDEMGGYCHDWHFTATIKINSWFKRERCAFCHGKGYRSVKSLARIRKESEAVTKAFLEENRTVVFHESINANVIECNHCKGYGVVKVDAFDLKDIEMSENVDICPYGCGYEVESYLEETIVILLSTELERYLQCPSS